MELKYSNQGDPSTPNQAYDNFGAGAIGYTVPSVSQLGEQSDDRSFQVSLVPTSNGLSLVGTF